MTRHVATIVTVVGLTRMAGCTQKWTLLIDGFEDGQPEEVRRLHESDSRA